MYLSLQQFFRGVQALVIIALMFLVAVGKMPAQFQSSVLSLSGNDSTLETWSELYSQGQMILQRQQDYLTSLETRISTLQIGYDELTNLSVLLSQSNEDLTVFNEQIGQRMEQRDMDLFWAYQEIDELEKTVLEKDKTILKLVIVIIVMGTVILGGIAIMVIRFYIKTKKPRLKL